MNQDTGKNQLSSRDILVALVAIALFVIPLAIKVIPVHSGSFVSGFSSGGFQLAKVYGNFDGFFLIKTFMLYLFAILLALLFSIAVRKDQISITSDKVMLISYGFSLWILFSSYLSMYPSEAFFGFRDRYEGVFVFCSYIMLMTVVRYTLDSDKHIHWLYFSIIVSSMIVAMISILQFFGFNMIESSYIATLIKGSAYKDVVTFGTSSFSAYGTLYNPNYLSGYMGMVLFLPITYYFFAERRWVRWSMLLISVLCWMALLSSKSSSGFIAGVIGLLIIAVIAILIDRRGWKPIAILIVCFVIAFIGMDLVGSGVMTKEYSSIFHYGFALGSKVFQEKDNMFEKNPILIGEKADDPRWEELLIYYPYESSLDRLGSGRGFIWRNTVKLIVEKPIVGYGLDTLYYNFPQGDLRKYYAFGRMNILVDKPHNLYLQLAYGAGIPALILFLLMNLMIIGKMAVIHYKLISNRVIDVRLLAVSMMIIAYLLQGLLNDSTVGVSVVYWCLLGLFLNYETGAYGREE